MWNPVLRAGLDSQSRGILWLISIICLPLIFPVQVVAQALSLERPDIQSANFLEDEAGITAYMNAGRTIDLSLVRDAYRTIEDETEEYILGSVALPEYSEEEDVHVYVSADGWIVAYYLKQEPVAKIFDFRAYYSNRLVRTLLEVAILEMVSRLPIQLQEIKYYHFAYPDANRLTIVVEDILPGSSADSFYVKLPSNLSFSERSYLHYFLNSDEYYPWTESSRMYIDETIISETNIDNRKYYLKYGIISPSILTEDKYRNIKLWASDNLISPEIALCVIALVYME